MSENKNLTLGKKLKDLRKSFCMTQDEIADLLNMSRTSFSKYENGAANPPLTVMRKLAKIYNVPIEYLIHDDETVLVFNDGKNCDEPDSDDLVSFFTQLTPEEKRIIMKIRLMESEKKSEIFRSINEDDN